MYRIILKRIWRINILPAIFFLLFISNSNAQISGCTDPVASNYNPVSAKNDGSCIYNATSVAPDLSFKLVSTLSETSGLIIWNNQLWTHNDNTDINLYALDTINGNIIQSHSLTGAVNTDWEEISQDEDYIYIGDFGNNQNGNRKDLKVLRINKHSVLINSPVTDTIQFSYSNQVDFNPTGSNNSDFDCEAFIVSSDSIYLFTKQWTSKKTSLYSLPKNPGKYVAKLKSTLDVHGLITGAVYIEPERLIALCGYSTLLEPFIFLLYDFSGSNYFGGNKRKIGISLPYHQIEGIATRNGLKYYATNEYFTFAPFISIAQKLHIFDLSPYLEKYFTALLSAPPGNKTENNIAVYPNPSTGLLKIEYSGAIWDKATLEIYDSYGNIVFTGYLESSEYQEFDLSHLSKGIYFLKIYNNDRRSYQKVILQ